MGLPLQVGFAPLDIELRMGLHPGMVRRRVIGDEVHQELEVSFLETLFETDEVRLRTEVLMQSVAGHREGRAADVGLGETRERGRKLLQPLGVA